MEKRHRLDVAGINGKINREITMAEHKLFYYPYASFTNAQLPLLKLAALYFDRLVILDPVGASWDTIGADRLARGVARRAKGGQTNRASL